MTQDIGASPDGDRAGGAAPKPCPFCGGEAWLIKHSSLYTDEYSVRCSACGVEVGDEYEDEAIRLWNTRPTTSHYDHGDDVERLIIAARVVAWGDRTREDIRELQGASEAFASAVPWDDEPSEASPARQGDAR